jgi:DNA-binding CsgD family transcriptional regulator
MTPTHQQLLQEIVEGQVGDILIHLDDSATARLIRMAVDDYLARLFPTPDCITVPPDALFTGKLPHVPYQSLAESVIQEQQEAGLAELAALVEPQPAPDCPPAEAKEQTPEEWAREYVHSCTSARKGIDTREVQRMTGWDVRVCRRFITSVIDEMRLKPRDAVRAEVGLSALMAAVDSLDESAIDDYEDGEGEAPEGTPAPTPPQKRDDKGLSPMQDKILRLVAEGKSNAKIGIELNLHPGSISTHLSNLYKKWGVNGREEALRKAQAMGLMEATA